VLDQEKADPARERLIKAGAALFAEHGFKGASVRQICASADTSINMIHHHFKSKQGLLDAVIDQFSSNVFATPARIMDFDPKSREDFFSRLELLFATTFEAFIEHRDTLAVVVRENGNPPAFLSYIQKLQKFLENAKSLGFVRPELDTEMITGFMLDRLLNQILHGNWIKNVYGETVVADQRKKREWLEANLSVFVSGISA